MPKQGGWCGVPRFVYSEDLVCVWCSVTRAYKFKNVSRKPNVGQRNPISFVLALANGAALGVPLTVGIIPALSVPIDTRLRCAGYVDTVFVVHFGDFDPHLAHLVRPLRTAAQTHLFRETFFQPFGADRILLSVFGHIAFKIIVTHIDLLFAQGTSPLILLSYYIYYKSQCM